MGFRVTGLKFYMNHSYHNKKEEQHEEVYYSCPMHPEVVRDTPGICPECGMQLVPTKKKKGSTGHEGHDTSTALSAGKHAGHSTSMFLRKFWVSLALTIPVVLYSDIAQKLLGLRAPQFAVSQYLPLLLGSIVFFYGGWVFLVGAWRELKAKLPGMMTLIAIAISAAYFFSVYATFGEPEHTLFWELTTLITIMLLGHWLEMRAVRGAQSALKELSKLLPDTAEVIRDGKTETVPLAKLKLGDVIFARPGGKIAADGEVIEGKSDINEAIVTGESRPVSKAPGSEVIAGTINGDGSLQIRVNKLGENTFLAGVMRLVAEAQASKSRLQILSDRAAFYLTLIALATGTLTFVLWLVAKAGIVFATERLVAVLVIACPHALGLAVPLVASISTMMAARNGLLIKQRLALEAARTIDIVLFDKTGTLTRGEFGVDAIIPVAKTAEAEVLRLAASVNSHSEHPIAKAMIHEAGKRGLKLMEVKNFQRIAGKGAQGEIEGKKIVVGNEVLLNEANAKFPENVAEDLRSQIGQLASQGKTVTYVILGQKLIGVIALADVIREESKSAIKALKAMGLKTAMITGDSEDVAAWVATTLSIDEHFAKVLPEEKAQKVKLLQSRGLKVAMIGDGVNDAPALTQADLGVAIGAGTNVAIESAGIILVKNDPRDIVRIIKLSRLTYTKMIQNLFWATGYNVVALPLAAGVLASKGILLEPALAAVFMSLSTVIVAVNALFLRRKPL